MESPLANLLLRRSRYQRYTKGGKVKASVFKWEARPKSCAGSQDPEVPGDDHNPPHGLSVLLAGVPGLSTTTEVEEYLRVYRDFQQQKLADPLNVPGAVFVPRFFDGGEHPLDQDLARRVFEDPLDDGSPMCEHHMGIRCDDVDADVWDGSHALRLQYHANNLSEWIIHAEP